MKHRPTAAPGQTALPLADTANASPLRAAFAGSWFAKQGWTFERVLSVRWAAICLSHLANSTPAQS